MAFCVYWLYVSVVVAPCVAYQTFDIIFCTSRNRSVQQILRKDFKNWGEREFGENVSRTPKRLISWTRAGSYMILFQFDVMRWRINMCWVLRTHSHVKQWAICVPLHVDEWWKIVHRTNVPTHAETNGVPLFNGVMGMLYVNANQINCHRLHPRQILTYSLLLLLARATVFALSILRSTLSLRRTEKRRQGQKRQNEWIAEEILLHATCIVYLSDKSLCNSAAFFQRKPSICQPANKHSNDCEISYSKL